MGSRSGTPHHTLLDESTAAFITSNAWSANELALRTDAEVAVEADDDDDDDDDDDEVDEEEESETAVISESSNGPSLLST